MKKLLRALALLPLLAHLGPAAFGAEPATATPHPAAEFLPAGSHFVEVMTLRFTERQADLALRFKQAAQANAEWLLEYVKANAEAGGALPYHPNFGMSADEYKEFLTFVSDARLGVGGRVTLKVVSSPAGRLTLDGGAELPELTGIVIDLAKDQVETPFGVASLREAVQASPDQKEAGSWSGYAWHLNEVEDPETLTLTSAFTTVRFSVGRLQETGRGILYYKAKKLAEGKTLGAASYTLIYDLPAASGGAPPAPAGETPPAAKPPAPELQGPAHGEIRTGPTSRGQAGRPGGPGPALGREER